MQNITENMKHFPHFLLERKENLSRMPTEIFHKKAFRGIFPTWMALPTDGTVSLMNRSR